MSHERAPRRVANIGDSRRVVDRPYACCAMIAEPIRVSIVEDDERVRGSFSRLVDRAQGFRCVSQHGDAEDAMRTLPSIRPDVVLMDINLPGISGVDGVRELKALLPQTQVVMLTVYEDTDLIFGALAAGATGYLLKRTPPDELLRGIRDVHGGGSPMSSHIARKVVQSFRQAPAETSDAEALSPREREVLDYLSRGYLYKEIAAKLSISYDTVHTYVRRIYEKFQVHSRTEAVAKHLTRAGQPRVAPRPSK
jgi:DNA-binding NarL/FixJ family response regulator